MPYLCSACSGYHTFLRKYILLERTQPALRGSVTYHHGVFSTRGYEVLIFNTRFTQENFRIHCLWVLALMRCVGFSHRWVVAFSRRVLWKLFQNQMGSYSREVNCSSRRSTFFTIIVIPISGFLIPIEPLFQTVKRPFVIVCNVQSDARGKLASAEGEFKRENPK